jgi:hypothetical protein
MNISFCETQYGYYRGIEYNSKAWIISMPLRSPISLGKGMDIILAFYGWDIYLL